MFGSSIRSIHVEKIGKGQNVCNRTLILLLIEKGILKIENLYNTFGENK